MKRIGILISAACLFAFGSCKKVNEATEFDIDYTSNVSVPAAQIIIGVPVDFESPDFETGVADRFASEKTTRELVDEIVLTKFNITALSGNLDYIKSISVYIKAEGLSDVLIATKSNIPAGSTSIAADMTGANIKEHVFKDKVRFRATITTNPGITQDQTLKMDQTVRVKGKKL